MADLFANCHEHYHKVIEHRCCNIQRGHLTVDI